MPRTLSFSPPRSLVTLRPNHTSRKTEVTTATSPRPPARTASVTSRSLCEALIAVSWLALPSWAFSMAPTTASEADCQSPAFTATVRPGLARIWLSMVWNCR